MYIYLEFCILYNRVVDGDFVGIFDNYCEIYNNLRYIVSLYGSWLVIFFDLIRDSFLDWFRFELLRN